jgi:hypothetical protein
MPDLRPHHRPETEVEGPLISTGMGRGLHSLIAIALVTLGVVLGLIAQSISAPVIAVLFLAAAVALLGEVPCLLRAGEVRARRSEQSKPNRFLVIRRSESPVRFHFYVATYGILGSFSLLIAALTFWQLLFHRAG